MHPRQLHSLMYPFVPCHYPMADLHMCRFVVMYLCHFIKCGKGFSSKPLDLNLCIKRRWINLNTCFNQTPNSTIHIIITIVLCISTSWCLLKTNQNNSLVLIIICKNNHIIIFCILNYSKL